MKKGALENWWDEESRKEFNRRKECLSDQYNGFYDNQTGWYVNGTKAITEIIADNGGVRNAYRAYSKICF